MKQSICTFLFCAVISATAWGKDTHHHTLPLDLTLEETHKLWQNHLSSHEKSDDGKAIEPETQASIDGGQKLAKWLDLINQTSRRDNPIRLSSAASQRGIPITAPNKYGPKTIKSTYQDLLKNLPASISEVVYGKKPIHGELPVDEATFIEQARKINGLYQTAVRWTTAVRPYIIWYRNNQKRDVRGYYNLKQTANLDQTLMNYRQLNEEQKTAMRDNLLGICNNSWGNKKRCDGLLKNALDNRSSRSLVDFKDSYWKAATDVWNSFFKITDPRKDVEWNSSAPERMQVVFADPSHDKIRDFLKLNIEDEFKNSAWNLQMDFVTPSLGTAFIKFQPNVTPHVTAGDIVVMDANTPLEEYEVQWTIRHEYGHILRIPDCYVEFYDEVEEVAVNYQLDTSDLMCSRVGKFNERLYNELKRVYYRP